jgi:hypothetical protein
MPRAPAKIRKRYQEGIEILGFEIEETLVYGESIIGPAIELRTLEDWKTAWAKWREVILPKSLEHRPGTRPFACYVVGEIPERQVKLDPPLSASYYKLYVPSRSGSGRWHYRYPEPYMKPEHVHLRDHGIIDAAEWKRAMQWRQQRTEDCPSRCQRETYPLEQGLYE